MYGIKDNAFRWQSARQGRDHAGGDRRNDVRATRRTKRRSGTDGRKAGVRPWPHPQVVGAVVRLGAETRRRVPLRGRVEEHGRQRRERANETSDPHGLSAARAAAGAAVDVGEHFVFEPPHGPSPYSDGPREYPVGHQVIYGRARERSHRYHFRHPQQLHFRTSLVGSPTTDGVYRIGATASGWIRRRTRQERKESEVLGPRGRVAERRLRPVCRLGRRDAHGAGRPDQSLNGRPRKSVDRAPASGTSGLLVLVRVSYIR